VDEIFLEFHGTAFSGATAAKIPPHDDPARQEDDFSVAT